MQHTIRFMKSEDTIECLSGIRYVYLF